MGEKKLPGYTALVANIYFPGKTSQDNLVQTIIAHTSDVFTKHLNSRESKHASRQDTCSASRG
eukprot:5570200-Amphidinium_carterae.1